jgi:hypothetical protein
MKATKLGTIGLVTGLLLIAGPAPVASSQSATPADPGPAGASDARPEEQAPIPKGAVKLGVRPAPAKPKAEAKKPEPAKPDEDRPFEEIVKDMEISRGLFTFYRKADETRVLLEVLPEQLDKVFLFSASIDQSVGERGLYAGQMGASFPFFFRQVGKNIQWVVKNTTFTAETNSPAARMTGRSFLNSVLATLRVKSKPHPQRKSHLLELNDLFLVDLPGLVNTLNEVYRPSAYRFDRNSSYLGLPKSFPENVLVEVVLNYVTDNPRTPSATLPDERSIPVVFKYDLSTLPDTGYRPRLGDDRVGHFLTVSQDFTSDRPTSPYVRRIHRWHLEKADPKAKLSPLKQPIVFWLENSIPVEYRAWFKEGILLWNRAFEHIGFRDALVVRQQPDDADWNAADTRFNTIRWFAGIDAAFAIGPSRVNPFTGQIYDADIGVSEGIIRFVRRAGEELISPVLPASQPQWPAAFRFQGGVPLASCEYAGGLAQQAAFGLNLLETRGALNPRLKRNCCTNTGLS